MGLKKGQTNNPKGRPPGTPNRSTDELRGIFQAFLENNLDTMQSDFDLLEPKDRLNFIERVAKMIIPPPLTLENLSEAQLEQLLNKLKNDNKIGISIYSEDINL